MIAPKSPKATIDLRRLVAAEQDRPVRPPTGASERLGARITRLDVNVREERSRLGAQCGDMGAVTIVDTGMRIARMEAVAEELGYALCVLAEGRTLRAAVDAAVERLLAAVGPLGGMTTEVQRVRAAGMAEAVRILQDELANLIAASASGR